MVEGEILYSVSVFSTKYFFGRHLESLLRGMAQWKGCCIVVLGEEPWDGLLFQPPFWEEQYWAIAISVNMCLEANCLGLINYLANLHLANVILVCEITSKKQASNYFLWLRTLYLRKRLSLKNAPWIKRKPQIWVNSWHFLCLFTPSEIK